MAARLARELVVVEEPRAEVIEAEFDGDGLGTEENAQALLDESIRLFQQGDPLSALSSIGKAVEIEPKNAQMWYALGELLGILGKTEEEIASWDRAVEIKPDYPEAWYNRGAALCALGRYEEAIASYERAVTIKLDYPEVWINRGEVAISLMCYSGQSLNAASVNSWVSWQV
ncbi:tetratricopeptide repeat protein [Roseofilum sp. Guam]|uniref:tetratricopeptide repeat protein n=1 Tax=Roseofilum sp. Guam TaxID=2821502 RepID=UPI001B14B552|nr:tetratricopeptide repeat protein [Roseofilum sp. Guam]MBP0029897.1 tetratricopeptide repeat protein [Roseofilum sp. Guam]